MARAAQLGGFWFLRILLGGVLKDERWKVCGAAGPVYHSICASE